MTRRARPSHRASGRDRSAPIRASGGDVSASRSDEASLIDHLEADESLAPELAAAAAVDDAHALLIRLLNSPDSHVTQEQVAKALNVTAGRVSQVIGGEEDMRVSTLARYVRALGARLSFTAVPAASEAKIPAAGRSIPLDTAEVSFGSIAGDESHRQIGSYESNSGYRGSVLLLEKVGRSPRVNDDGQSPASALS